MIRGLLILLDSLLELCFICGLCFLVFRFLWIEWRWYLYLSLICTPIVIIWFWLDLRLQDLVEKNKSP